jgi:hypothetical protein
LALVSKSIINNYFVVLTQNPPGIADFFAKNATLVWCGKKIDGKLQIYENMKAQEKFVYQVSSADSQVVVINDCYSMLTVTGFANKGTNTFHFISTFYIKAIKGGEAAVIVFQDFYVRSK